jgi:hypothetical protein
MKERSLPPSIGDGRYCYYTLSTKLGGSTPTLKDALNYWHAFGRDYYITSQVVAPAFMGGQYFTSTEHKRPIFNDCLNRKSVYVNYPYTAITGISPSYLKVYPYRRDEPTMYPLAADLSSSRVDSLFASIRGWHHLQPRFEGEVQMLNFIFELKDFKDIARHITKIDVRKIKKVIYGLKRHNPELNVVEPSKLAAQAWLMNAMALQPLIKDYAAILANAKQLSDEALTAFKAKGLDTQDRHYSEVLETTGSNTSSWSGTKTGTLIQTRFTSTLQYKYGYREISDKRAFEKYWGLVWSPSVVHNMGPFSFLLDYFVGLGDALTAIELDKNLLLEPFQYCESTLKESVSGRWIGGSPGWPQGILLDTTQDPDGSVVMNPKPNILISGYRKSVYQRERKPWPRRGLYIPKLSLPNTRQGINMLALARVFL